MADFRFSAVIVQAATAYALQLAPESTVGQIARYLAQQEGYVEGSTLEIARRLPPDQHLADVDMLSGDRLLIVTGEPEPAELTTLSPGDSVLKIAGGNFEISSKGKKNLLVGRTDEAGEIYPDVDLREFASARALEFISRRCVQLYYDDQRKGWLLRRLGNNRLVINDFELTEAPFPMGAKARLRIYRAHTDPVWNNDFLLAELELRTEQVLADAKLVYLPGGSFDLPVWTGLERETIKLNASGRLSIDQIAHSLLVKQKIGRGTAYRTYLLSLIAPATPVSAVKLNKDEFLYAARSVIYTHSRLVLHDTYNRSQTYELVAGRQDEEKLVGRRTRAEEADPRLDVDLFHSASRPEAPEAFKSISRQQMRIIYKVTENMWWAQLEERTTVPVYVNNLRLTSGTPIQLISGDVLTFGPSVEQYYARLEVEVFTRLE